jgi:imidazolonepropionase-like amidohydrolase
MKNIHSFALMFFFIGLFIPIEQFCQYNHSSDISKVKVLEHINIIDIENGNISHDMSIIIVKNRISNIGKSFNLKIPTDAIKYNCAGKFVIPGLWDMHAHSSSETNTRNIIYPLFIANGITSVRIMSADCISPCHELSMNISQSKQLQKEIIKGDLVGPRLILGSNYVGGPKPGELSTIDRPGNEVDARKYVQNIKNKGVDFIKIYDMVPRDAYFSIANEANKLQIPFAGHNPQLIKTSEASEAGQKSIEHCCEVNFFRDCSTREEELSAKFTKEYLAEKTTGINEVVYEMVKSYDKNKCIVLWQQFIKNKTYFVPTLFVEDISQSMNINWRKSKSVIYVPKNELKYWSEDEVNFSNYFGKPYKEIREKRFEIVRDMQKAGVDLMAGSDCGVIGVFYGESLHEELRLLVQAGLSELEALQSATLKPSEYNRSNDSLGKIKKSMLADLLVLDANPLLDIRNTKRINMVISNGIFFDRNRLDKILKNISIEAAK